MNILRFEQSNCKKFQAYLDSYINNELLVETTNEVLTHLESCPNCSVALRERQRLKDRLKDAVLKDSAPTYLQERIRKSIHEEISPGWTRLICLAAAMIAFIAVVGGTLQFFNRSTAKHSETAPVPEGANERLLQIGLDDHVKCALDMGFADRLFTEEDMRQALGAGFGGLVEAVQQKAPETYRLVVGHRCQANRREYVHLILKSWQTILSLVITNASNCSLLLTEHFTTPRASAYRRSE